MKDLSKLIRKQIIALNEKRSELSQMESEKINPSELVKDYKQTLIGETILLNKVLKYIE